MKLNRFAALAALALALAPAARLDAQAAPGSAHRGHAEHHARHHAKAGEHARHDAKAMPCAHGEGAHAATPAMLVAHRAEVGLSEEQVRRLRALGPDDAAGARAVLTAEQRGRVQAMHAATPRAHGGGAHEHCADCCDGEECEEDCCSDGKCCGHDCCDEDCCPGGECDERKCRECCERMGAAGGAQAPRG